jgi:hypothetical protein
MIAENKLDALKQRWLTSGSFHDEQAYLSARVRMKDVRFVYLDPDGTLPAWIAVVVCRETGVVYGTQCAGAATEQRFIEGYLVPVGGSKYDADQGSIQVGPFVDVFHEERGCRWGWTGRVLPIERLARLENLIAEISFWTSTLDAVDQKFPLSFDPIRREQLVEAWIPVQTPDGPGVLVYKNCD